MKRSEKFEIIGSLTEQINSSTHFYLTDIEGLNAAKTSSLRRLCNKQKVELVVVKNTLLRKALEASNKNAEELSKILMERRDKSIIDAKAIFKNRGWRMPILLTRIDDRLIHGQVVVGWAQELKINHIIVVNDEIVSNELRREFFSRTRDHIWETCKELF